MIFWKEYNDIQQALRNKKLCRDYALQEINRILKELRELLNKEMMKIFTDEVMDTNVFTDEITEWKKLRNRIYKIKCPQFCPSMEKCNYRKR